MAIEKIVHIIRGDGPGRSTELVMFRCRPDHAQSLDRLPKVYCQASLHADEQPGMMVLHHLLKHLRALDAAGKLAAEFIIVPMANPLGFAQLGFRQHQGRYDNVSGVNFNRQWPNLLSLIRSSLPVEWSSSAEANQQKVREAVRAWLSDWRPVKARDQQQKFIMQAAYDADYVFDLHCDNDALLHIFAVPQLFPEYQALADWIGAAATLTAEDSGGGSFDEVWPALWIELVAEFPEVPFPMPSCAATLEYRGNYDVFDALNQDDAERLLGFFAERGLVNWQPTVAKTEARQPTALAATEMLRVEQAGLLAYQVELGDWVESGQVIAELIPMDGETAFEGRIPIRCTASGQVISRNVAKYVWAGCSIAKIVGETILPSRGEYLLED